MTVNTFFILVISGLIGIYLFFNPMTIAKQEEKEVAQLDLVGFTIYELDQNRLISTMSGSEGKRFQYRYEINDVNYTDKKFEFTQNMVADFAVYRNDKIFLDKNVRYKREDGLMFTSDEAKYNTKNSVATTKGRFSIEQNGDWVTGEQLRYNSKKERIKAKNVKGDYNLLDKKEYKQ